MSSSIFLHSKLLNSADKLNFKLAVHDSKNGPLTSEMNQLLGRIESDNFLNSEDRLRLSYLTCTAKTESKFDAAIEQNYLLELI
jgi:hypothetical protein